MKTIFASAALFVAGALAQSFTINTPSSVVECEPSQISWSGGTAPYYLSVLPGTTPNGTPIESFPTTNATSYTWTVNIESGTYIGFTLRDGDGALAQSAALTIEAGSSSSCLTGGSSASGTSTSASAGATATSPSTTAGTTGGSSASPSSSSTSSSSGASANAAQFGAAGIVGAAVAALFL